MRLARPAEAIQGIFMIEATANPEISWAANPNGDGSLKTAEWSYTPAEIAQFKHNDVLFAVAFAKIVSLMMHSPSHAHLHLSDLTWLVAPPLLAEQIAIVEAVRQGRSSSLAICCGLVGEGIARGGSPAFRGQGRLRQADR
jgi:hypothetical protein